MAVNQETQVAFSPGSGVLVVVPGRFAFMSEDGLSRSIIDGGVYAAETTAFFRAAVTAWMTSDTPGTFAAGVFDDDSVTIVAAGTRSFSVTTSEEHRVIDPSQSAFIGEHRLRGSLTVLRFGGSSESPAEVASEHRYAASEGVLPVSGFEVRVGNGSTPVPHLLDLTTRNNDATATATATATAPATAPATADAGIAPKRSFESARDESLVTGSIALLTGTGLTHGTGEVDEERVDEGFQTVIPTVDMFPPPIDPELHREAVGTVALQPGLAVDVVDDVVDDGVDDVGSQTLHWANPVFNERATDDSSDDADVTIMTGDMSKYRPTNVHIVNQPLRKSTDDILGAYCSKGHFTDTRKIICLFCDNEVEFGRFGTAPRPLLGQLHFADGDVVDLDKGVIIGRHPTQRDGEEVHLVSFADDKLLSRVHAEVKLNDWDVVVVDRQSANGTHITFPDGRVVTVRPNLDNIIDDGAVVRFGDNAFTFRRVR